MDFIKKNYKKSVIIVGIIIIHFLILLFPVKTSGHAAANDLKYPTFGLYCTEANKIISGNEKFDLTNLELFSKHKAIKESEYQVSGNSDTVFEIPFFSTYLNIPQFNVTVNGQAVDGKVWYGDNQIYYGGSNSYLQVDNTDNSVLEKKLKRVYSPILNNTVVGKLFTVTPNADSMSVEIELKENYKFIYDDTNINNYSSESNGTIQKYEYMNALSKTNYQYFFVGENIDINFSATCIFESEQITFKDFIDRNYNLNKKFYEEKGVTIECVYSLANRFLEENDSIEYKNLFYSINNVALNSYKFIVSLNGDSTIKFSSTVDIQAITKYDPTIYAVGQKQINNYTTNYTVTLNSKIPYIVQSSTSTKKSGTSFKAVAKENYYFMCSSVKKPADPNAPKPTNSPLFIILIISLVVLGILFIYSIANLIIYLRNNRKLK